MENKKFYLSYIVGFIAIVGILIGVNKQKEVIVFNNNNAPEVFNVGDNNSISNNNSSNEIASNETTNNEELTIVVYISGEVNNPAVYSVNPSSRVIDVVDLAGGVTDNADTNKINLAKKITDGEHIIIPAIGDGTVASTTPSLININTATKEELKTLSGIGDVTADSIIKYRDNNNGFENIDEIKKVSGIGNSTFENLKDYITVNGG